MMKKFGSFAGSLIYNVLGVLSFYPLACLLTGYFAPEFPYWALTAAVLPAAFILPLTSGYRKVAGAAAQLALTATVVFVVFQNAPVSFQTAAALFCILLFAILYKANSEPSVLGGFCGFIFLFNLCIGHLLHNTPTLDSYANVFAHSIYVSVLSSLTFFILHGIDGARRFGADRLAIPSAMRRNSAAIIAACAVLTLITATFVSHILGAGSWLLRSLRFVIEFAAASIVRFFRYLLDLLPERTEEFQEYPEPPADPFAGLPLDEGEAVSIPDWLTTAITVTAALLIAAAVLTGLVRMLIKLYRYLTELSEKLSIGEDIAYTETIEKIGDERFAAARARRRVKRGKRYPANASEREKIQFIYGEYVGMAAKQGYTKNRSGQTPCEILNEIDLNTVGEAFPKPENLGDVYNAARYGHDGLPVSGADGFRKRLL
jgi:hypothetical protein